MKLKTDVLKLAKCDMVFASESDKYNLIQQLFEKVRGKEFRYGNVNIPVIQHGVFCSLIRLSDGLLRIVGVSEHSLAGAKID